MSRNDELRETQSNDFTDEYIVEKANDSKKNAFRLIKRLAQQKWKLLIVFISIAISSVFMILSPKVMGLTVFKRLQKQAGILL